MPTTTEIPAVDFEAVKQKQQKTWSSGDFSVIAGLIERVADDLVDAADLHAGWRVLDVATGSGNAAIAAARLGTRVTGLDYVPQLLERARQRAEAEGFEIEFVEGDAEALPFGDAEFDAVTTMFGSMFAPNHPQAAAELVRVVKPGGTIAIAAWTPNGFIGELFKTTAKHVPPPAGVQSPLLWGTEAHLHGLFGDSIASLRAQERVFTYRLRAAEEFCELFRRWYGPTLKAFEALETDEARAALQADIDELAKRWDRLESDDAVAIPAAYLETVVVTR
ncbi:MAG: class I SAM-dependent methyltransferase [Gaiellaceae bacterium]